MVRVELGEGGRVIEHRSGILEEVNRGPRHFMVAPVKQWRGGHRGEVVGDFPSFPRMPCHNASRNNQETSGMYNGGEGDQMTAQAKGKRGIQQNLLGRKGRKAPEVAPAVTEPSQQIAAPDFAARGVGPLRRGIAESRRTTSPF